MFEAHFRFANMARANTKDVIGLARWLIRYSWWLAFDWGNHSFFVIYLSSCCVDVSRPRNLVTLVDYTFRLIRCNVAGMQRRVRFTLRYVEHCSLKDRTPWPCSGVDAWTSSLGSYGQEYTHAVDGFAFYFYFSIEQFPFETAMEMLTRRWPCMEPANNRCKGTTLKTNFEDLDDSLPSPSKRVNWFVLF